MRTCTCPPPPPHTFGEDRGVANLSIATRLTGAGGRATFEARAAQHMGVSLISRSMLARTRRTSQHHRCLTPMNSDEAACCREDGRLTARVEGEERVGGDQGDREGAEAARGEPWIVESRGAREWGTESHVSLDYQQQQQRPRVHFVRRQSRRLRVAESRGYVQQCKARAALHAADGDVDTAVAILTASPPPMRPPTSQQPSSPIDTPSPLRPPRQPSTLFLSFTAVQPFAGMGSASALAAPTTTSYSSSRSASSPRSTLSASLRSPPLSGIESSDGKVHQSTRHNLSTEQNRKRYGT